eukprot:RCo012608
MKQPSLSAFIPAHSSPSMPGKDVHTAVPTEPPKDSSHVSPARKRPRSTSVGTPDAQKPHESAKAKNGESTEGGSAPPPKKRWFPGLSRITHSAKNPGSKAIPRGAENCLEGKTFVFTGQLESLDRTEAEDLVKRHGGTVRGNISGKTDFVVMGDDPGSSKISKLEKLHTKQLSEDELLDYIADCSKKRGVDAWAWLKAEDAEDAKDGDDTQEEDTSAALPAPAHPAPVRSPPKSALGSSASSSCSFVPAMQQASSSTQSIASLSGYVEEQLWADKHRPKSTKDMIAVPQLGHLRSWLQSWELSKASKDFKKAALLSGLPGVGKTTAAHLVGQECGYEVVEWNASDKRNKTQITALVADMVGNTSVRSLLPQLSQQLSRKRFCIVMDEVDGCDRGGVGEIIAMIRRTKVPIICICNDRYHPKLKSLVQHCLDLKFNKPALPQVTAYVQAVLRREGREM